MLERLRQVSDVPVIVVSAKREEEDRVAALDRGADDYLVKPITVRELVARVRAVLRRSDGGAADAVQSPPARRHCEFPPLRATPAGEDSALQDRRRAPRRLARESGGR